MAKSRENMSLEVYLRFFLSREQDLLTVDILRQIVKMHGYRKIRIARKGLTAAVNKLDLMDPWRSTLQDNSITSSAIISVEDIVADLNQLNWQECCVSSLQTFNSCERALSALKSYDKESTMKFKKVKSESRSHTHYINETTSSSRTSAISTNNEAQYLACIPFNSP